ncbi:MAG: MerR family transcriptional regulator [Gammaproteobacteria bacterium]|nr:MerR family transcriptional regulator [Gammaproteobacteria bacterium]MCY4219152.1 MerR family transcriptional regulator [Gammaproteobacteria bacterium]MCY4275886.1 MerR family transcriptional regulator [Gammaproteobacteria bacterium]
MLDAKGYELPPIPPKRYFAIGEVSKLCEVKPHVLRYWEQEFPHLKPVKRRGNRRYYQFHEVELVREIRRLLQVEGYTIPGARTQLDSMKQFEPKSKNKKNQKTDKLEIEGEFLYWLTSELRAIRKILE